MNSISCAKKPISCFVDPAGLQLTKYPVRSASTINQTTSYSQLLISVSNCSNRSTSMFTISKRQLKAAFALPNQTTAKTTKYTPANASMLAKGTILPSNSLRGGKGGSNRLPYQLKLHNYVLYTLSN